MIAAIHSFEEVHGRFPALLQPFGPLVEGGIELPVCRNGRTAAYYVYNSDQPPRFIVTCRDLGVLKYRYWSETRGWGLSD